MRIFGSLFILSLGCSVLRAAEELECDSAVGMHKAEKIAVFINDVSRDFAQSLKSPAAKTSVKESSDSWTFTVAVPQLSNTNFGAQLWEVEVSKVLCRIHSVRKGMHEE